MRHGCRIAPGTIVVAVRRIAAAERCGQLARWPAACWRRRCPGPVPTRPNVVEQTTWPAAVPSPARCGCARSSARPAANARPGRRSCLVDRSFPDLRGHSRSRQWPVRSRPVVLHTSTPHRPLHPVRVMTCDPACRWESMAADPTAHRRLAPCNPAVHPITNCAMQQHQQLRDRPNTPPAAYQCLPHPPAPPRRTRAHPHVRSSVPRSHPTRCGNHES